MARNLYSAYRAAGSSSGQYKASLFDVESKEEKMAFADKRGAWEQEKLSRNVEAIGAGLELVSTVAGGAMTQQERAADIQKAFPGAEQTYGEAKWSDVFRSDASAGRTAGETRWGELGEKLAVSLGGKERQWQIGEGFKGIDPGEYKQSEVLTAAKASTYGKLGLDVTGEKDITMEKELGGLSIKASGAVQPKKVDEDRFKKAAEKGYDTSAADKLLQQGKVKQDFIGPPVKKSSLHEVKSGESLTGLAKQWGMSLDQILQLNPTITDPNKISVGQQITY